MTGPDLRDKIRAEASENAFNDALFEAVCRCVTDVRETLRAHGKPDLVVERDDRLTDALMETINTAIGDNQ